MQTRTPMRPPLPHQKFIKEPVCRCNELSRKLYETSKHTLACFQAGLDTEPRSYPQADPYVAMVTNQLRPFQQGHVASGAATGQQGCPNLLSRYNEGHWGPTRLAPDYLEPLVARFSQSPGLEAHKDQGLRLRVAAPPVCGGRGVVRRP